MTKKLDWTPDVSLPTGKGATVQRFTATDGKNKLEIYTAPWGEGDLTINGVKRAHVENEKSAPRAFRDLDALTERFEQEEK